MKLPLNENLNPTKEELYDDLYLDYFFEKTKRAFPSVLSEVEEFQILVRLMAWAVARSYQQPRILKYLYDPDLVMDELLPRLADTLDFKYPINYPLDQLRTILKYLQKIRRSRGTWNSVKQLIRLLEITEDELLSLSFKEYSSVDVIEDEPGFVYVTYNRINDWDFANEMLRMVMPAGYRWRLESSSSTEGLSKVYRNKLEIAFLRENIIIDTKRPLFENREAREFIAIHKEWVDSDNILHMIDENSVSGFTS